MVTVRCFLLSYEWDLHYGAGESLLAFSTAKGNIGLVKVAQTLQSGPSIGLVQEYTTSAVFDVQGPICEADKRSVTSLTWVQPPRRNVPSLPLPLVLPDVF